MIPGLNITKGGAAAQRLLVYGPPGSGKTTFCAGQDQVLFITAATEDGAGRLGVPTAVVKSWKEFRDALQAVVAAKGGGYRSLVIDSITKLEKYLWTAVAVRMGAQGRSLTEAADFQGGKSAAEHDFAELLQLLERIRQEGINITIISHLKVEMIKDPSGADYPCRVPDLDKRLSPQLVAWADHCVMALKEPRVERRGRKGGVSASALEQGKVTGWDRVLVCEAGPAAVCKSRDQVAPRYPLDWAAFAKAVRWDAHRGDPSPAVTSEKFAALLQARVKALTCVKVTKPELAEEALGLKAGALAAMPPAKLSALCQRLADLGDEALGQKLMAAGAAEPLPEPPAEEPEEEPEVADGPDW